MRTVHNVIQGSPEWRALRAKHLCASDAPVMQGASPHLTRSEFVRLMATGSEREISEYQQKLFDKGHEVEAFARSVLEERLGEDLYPATITEDEYLASSDGITMDGDTSMEAKLWNAELAESVRSGNLTPLHYWQAEQQIMVFGVRRVCFVMTDGTRERWVECEYTSKPERRKELIAGWKQLLEDVKNYVPVVTPDKPEAEAVLALPSLTVRIEGEIALKSNVAVYGEQLQAFIARIVKSPSTDQDFANAEAAVKTLKEAEDRLTQAEESGLAQVATVDELRRQIALFRDLARDTRLALDKAVKARKEVIRDEIRVEGISAISEHVSKLNVRLGRTFVQVPDPHAFAEAMKGKKSIATLREAMQNTLLRMKLATSETADRIEANLKAVTTLPGYQPTIFADLASLVAHDAESCLALAVARILQHEKAEAEKKAFTDAQAAAIADFEATAGRAPLLGAAARPSLAVVPKGSSAKPLREQPSDAALLEILSLHYTVSEEEVFAWLRTFDFEAQAARLSRVAAAE